MPSSDFMKKTCRNQPGVACNRSKLSHPYTSVWCPQRISLPNCEICQAVRHELMYESTKLLQGEELHTIIYGLLQCIPPLTWGFILHSIWEEFDTHCMLNDIKLQWAEICYLCGYKCVRLGLGRRIMSHYTGSVNVALVCFSEWAFMLISI